MIVALGTTNGQSQKCAGDNLQGIPDDLIAGHVLIGRPGARPITDAGLVHLKGLTNLEGLLLIGTQVTDAGVAKLKEALPDCRISR